MGLGTELGRVRSWPDSLASEPAPELKALGERLRPIVAQGDQALEQRRKAAATRADHRGPKARRRSASALYGKAQTK